DAEDLFAGVYQRDAGAVGQVDVGGAAFHTTADDGDLIAELQRVLVPTILFGKDGPAAELGLPVNHLSFLIGNIEDKNAMSVDQLHLDNTAGQSRQLVFIASGIAVVRKEWNRAQKKGRGHHEY